ncbi:hypothetical protein AB0H82_04325 [Streptomyces sp. NPDC050732]|uniref:hypothetical protein n=1 Tax=Streptomyces sp. NPDC050732 TaxID=3154632 RepID=UPI003439FFB1
MTRPSIAVAGTGAFAGALVRALARHPQPLSLHILSSAARRAADLAELGRDHAALAGAPVTCTPHEVHIHHPDELERLLATVRADALVVSTSEHSPAERTTAPSAWTALLAETGFGLTLPLQATHVLRYGQACRRATPDTLLVNACFPDAVNPVLTALGTPVTCGLGNVATLAAVLAAQLDLVDQSPLHLLAHHAHLHPPASPADEARAWLDGGSTDLTRRLTSLRRRDRAHLNEVGAAAAAAPLAALVGAGPTHHGHLPGPAGLPGGYPVTVRHRRVDLRLPPGLTRDEAIAWNTERGRLDGTAVGSDGTVRLEEPALAALRRHWPSAPGQWSPTDLTRLRADLLRLRDRMRSLPVPAPAGPPPTPSLQGATP